MQFTKWAAGVAAVGVILFSPAPIAQSPAVTFSAIADAVPNAFFDAAQTRADAVNPNRLIVGFNAGVDLTTFKFMEFRASTDAFNHLSAMDTLKVTVTAPTGFYIETITYSQQGFGSDSGTGRAAGGASWVVGDTPGSQLFSTDPALSWTVNISDQVLTSVPLSVTNSLFVHATPNFGAATVSITSADVRVTVLPCASGGNGKGKGGGKKDQECRPVTTALF
jgi:hypothetical protein